MPQNKQKEYHRKYMRKWCSKNKAKWRIMCQEYSRKHSLKKNHGLSLDQYDAMWLEQIGVCAICHKAEKRQQLAWRKDELSVDHDHKTGKIRGLLCRDCNRAIGLLKDSQQLLLDAVGYLRQSE